MKRAFASRSAGESASMTFVMSAQPRIASTRYS